MTSKLAHLLAQRIQTHRRALWDWHMQYAKQFPPPFYCSIDLRDSGAKIVPVDSNLYPAGFNNICPEDLRVAPMTLRAQIEAICLKLKIPTASRILILPEAHTKNSFYIENLFYLHQMIENAGFECQIGWYGPTPEPEGSSMAGVVELVSATGKRLRATTIEIHGGVASLGQFVPELILLNNDFSSGYPTPLDQVIQPIIPSHQLGWHSRKKSEHFIHYNRLAREFAQIIDIDPWMIQIDTQEVTPVNFSEEQGLETTASVVDQMLQRIKKEFQARKIDRDPFVFIKNNSGTYGMGVMVARSPEEVLTMNRRLKTKMSTGKNKLPIQSVIVQEGVPTATLVDRLAAEPVIYLLGCELIGGFLRTNTEKGDTENLNSQGMVFKKLCMSDLRTPETDLTDETLREEPILELAYGSIARISALATGMELASHSG
ncbi:MAG: glutamate--cysteine ligase [Bdellovibrionia bacterium]